MWIHIILTWLALMRIEAKLSSFKKFSPKIIATGDWNPIRTDTIHPTVDPHIYCAIRSSLEQSSAYTIDGSNCCHGINESIVIDPSIEPGKSISVDGSKLKSEFHIFTLKRTSLIVTEYPLGIQEIQIRPIPELLEALSPFATNLIRQPWGFVACDRSSKRCFSWIMGTSQWEPSSPMLFDHLDHGVMGTDVDGKFYFISGKGSTHLYGHGHTEYLHPNGSWLPGPKMPQSIYQCGFAGLSQEEIIVFGGYRQGSISDQITIFNLETGDLLDIGQLSSARRASTCSPMILANGTGVVICIGGVLIDNTSSHEVVLVSKDTKHWELVPNWALPSGASHVSIIWNEIDRLLYLFGGSFANSNVGSVFQFNESGPTYWERLIGNSQIGHTGSLGVSFIAP